jgi:hypothetical protein
VKRFFWPALVAVVALVAIYPCVCEGSPLDCEGIRDPDQRHLCRAASKGDKAECEFIHDHDLRQECRARVKP